MASTDHSVDDTERKSDAGVVVPETSQPSLLVAEGEKTDSTTAPAAEAQPDSGPVRTVVGIKVCIHQSDLDCLCSSATTLEQRLLTLLSQWFLAYASVLSTVLLFAIDGTIVSVIYSKIVPFSHYPGCRYPACHHRQLGGG